MPMSDRTKPAILCMSLNRITSFNTSAMFPKQKYILLAGLVIVCEFYIALQVQAAQKPGVFSAVFTTAVEDRYPVDQVLLLTNTTDKIFFYTDLRYFENRKIIHRWEFNDKVISSKQFNIKGPRWRVYSSKTLRPDQLGTWRVVVTTEDGWPLRAAIFKYVDSKTGRDAILPWTK